MLYPHVFHKNTMLYTYTLTSSFQSLFAQFRPMTSHHVIYHITTVICLFIVNKKKNQKERNIKSRKIDKRKRKMLVFKCTIIFRSFFHSSKTQNNPLCSLFVINFIQLVSPQPVDWYLQTKLYWKVPNEGYLHICGRYKSNNK